MSFDYAHKDTSSIERKSETEGFNKPNIGEQLKKLRELAFKREIPVSDDETLSFIINMVRAVRPENILEIGAAVGVSGIAMLQSCGAKLTTIEKNPQFFEEAKKNFEEFGLSDRVNAICGDAAEVLPSLSGGYDFVFLDCAKVQYIKYLPLIKKLLKRGGVLLADDVLLFGYVTGEAPKKRKMLVEHVKEYVSAVTEDAQLSTTIINIGNGIALSVKL